MSILDPNVASKPSKSFVEIVVGLYWLSLFVNMGILHRGEDVIHFIVAEVSTMAKPFKLSLMGKFSFGHLQWI